MAWAAVNPPDPELTLKANGDVTWNSALQKMLSDPEWVDLMWDADASMLGVGGHDASCGGFPVSRDEATGTYTIDSSAALSDLGVSANPAHTEAPPGLWENAITSADMPSWRDVYYITL